MASVPDVRREVHFGREVSGTEIADAVKSVAEDYTHGMVFFKESYDSVLGDDGYLFLRAVGDYPDVDTSKDSGRFVVGVNPKAAIGNVRVYTGETVNEPGVDLNEMYDHIGLRGTYGMPAGTMGDEKRILSDCLGGFEKLLLDVLKVEEDE